MDNDFTVTIKLKPILQQYLMHGQNEYVVASKRTFIGKLLHLFLTPIPPGSSPFFPSTEDYITLHVPLLEDVDLRNGIWVSPENQMILENILDAHFKEVFLLYVSDKTRYSIYTLHGRLIRKSRIKDTIIQFCADYGLSYNDLYYESLKKRHYRNRKRFEVCEEFITYIY